MQAPDLDPNAPWKTRFRLPLVAHSQIAKQDPTRGLVIANTSGVYQLYAWEVPTGTLRQVTDKPGGVVFGGISEDGRYIYYHDDIQGDEVGYYMRVPFNQEAEAENILPGFEPFASFSMSESADGQHLSFTVATSEGFHVILMRTLEDGSLSQPKLLHRGMHLNIGAFLSHGGEHAVIATTERTNTPDYSLIALDLKTNGRLELQEDDASLRPVGFAPVAGDTRFLATSDGSGEERPVIWDVATGDRIDIPLHDVTGDVSALGWSPDGTRLLLRQMHRAKTQLYIYDIERSLFQALEHPGGKYNTVYFADDDTLYANWQDATHPLQVVALDAHTGAQKHVVLAMGDVPVGRPWRSVEFLSSGNVEVQAWLATPEGEAPFPTVVHAHGGPSSVQEENFFPMAQAFLDHGLAFMSVNYRGSVSFGADFQQAIWGMLGMREVDDLAAACQWLILNGIARQDAILLTGSGYGGFLTLQALGRRPDLWAGGMAQVAIADWRLTYEDEPESLRGYQRMMFGGTPEEREAQYRNSSPLTYAEAIAAPLLVIQSYNDLRFPARQMQTFEETMAELGKNLEIHWYDAAQPTNLTEQGIEHTELMLQFAYEVLS